MLVAREAEQEQVRKLLARARAGSAGLLEVVGEPGIGKSALLAQARHLADGFDVVDLVGLPAEQATAYAGLSDLLRHLGAAPGGVLRQAVGLEPPDGREVNDLTLGAALLDLLARYDGRPLLLCVDDTQWLDAETRRPLAFALRRLGGEPVTVLLATRDDAPPLLDLEHQLHLRGLPPRDVRALVRAAHTDVSAEVCDALAGTSAGNPLAVLESVRDLSPQQRSGAAPLPVAGPLPERLREAFTRRLDLLPERCRRLLLLAAVEGRGDTAVVAAAGEAPLDAVVAAEEAGLVTLTDGRIVFVHPLVTATVLAVASPAAVRAAHAALSAALAGAGDGDRALHHAAAAAIGPDDDLAQRLVAAAEHDEARGGHGAASTKLERGAALTPDPAGRTRLLARAADAALAAGAVDRADALAAGAVGEEVADAVRGRVAVVRGRFADAVPHLLRAAAAAQGRTAAVRYEAAVSAALDAGDPRLAADAAAQAQRVPDAATDPVLRLLLARVDSLLAARTGHLGLAAGVISGPLEAVAGGAGFGRDGAAWMVYAAALLDTGDVAAGRDAYATAAGIARGASDRFATAEALEGQAFADHALGRWTSAYANGTLALGLLDADTAPFSVAGLQHLLADVDAARGRSESCLRRCAQVRALGQQLDLLELQVLAERREGALHLATNRLDDAVRHLERARSLLRRTPVHHPILSPVPDLVETFIRLRRPDAAAALVPEFAVLVGEGAPPPAVARLLRTRALVADDDEYAGLFQEAIDLDDRTDMRFFQARTRLCFGERLRRERHQVLAREQLSAALGVFEEVDARPWADRARGELAATGVQVRQASIGGVADLTPQELQIALAVAEGRRNKEIAGALFLSVRTVEFHLTRTFTKLGVRSRGELTARLTSQRPQ